MPPVFPRQPDRIADVRRDPVRPGRSRSILRPRASGARQDPIRGQYEKSGPTARYCRYPNRKVRPSDGVDLTNPSRLACGGDNQSQLTVGFHRVFRKPSRQLSGFLADARNAVTALVHQLLPADRYGGRIPGQE